MGKKITLSNIKNYVQGNFNMIMSKTGFTSESFKEQIAYRMLLCTDCIEKGACEICGCDAPDRLFTNESCNKSKFPDIMNAEDWIKFKSDNGIN